MLILRPTRKSLITKAPCCSGCGSGKPCCGKTKRKPRRPILPFKKSGGVWVPNRKLIWPRALLDYPAHHEWSGRFKSWDAALAVAFDLSCTGCCACETCVCCTECPTQSELIQFQILGLADTDFCTCTAFASLTTLTNSAIPNLSCVWQDNGEFCTGIVFGLTLEIVQEAGECIMRMTMSGDSSGGSGGGGGPFEVIFELLLSADGSPINCSTSHELAFVSQTPDNSPCDFSAATVDVTISFT